MADDTDMLVLLIYYGDTTYNTWMQPGHKRYLKMSEMLEHQSQISTTCYPFIHGMALLGFNDIHVHFVHFINLTEVMTIHR